MNTALSTLEYTAAAVHEGRGSVLQLDIATSEAATLGGRLTMASSSTRRLAHVSDHLASASPATTAGVLKWVKGLFSGGDNVATSAAPVESDAVAVCAHADFPRQDVSGGHVCVFDLPFQLPVPRTAHVQLLRVHKHAVCRIEC